MKDRKDIQNNIDDEKELDDLFDKMENNKVHKILKRAKWKAVLRTVIVSLVAFGVVAGGSVFIGHKLTEAERSSIEGALLDFNYISAPNQYQGKSVRYQEAFGGETIYSTYKILEGKVVYTGQQSYSYGLLKPSNDVVGIFSPSIIGTSYDEDDVQKPRYNELGQREMVFFYPFINYQYYRNDLNLLEAIDEDKYLEMALSFDKTYNLAELRQLLPQDVTVAWYWVDDLNEGEKVEHQPRQKKQQTAEGKTELVNYPGRVRSEKTAYGIKNYGANGDPIDNPEELFIAVLNNSYQGKDELKGDSSKMWAYKSEFERVYKNIAGADGKLTTTDLKIQGIVVTGDTDSLKSLRGLSFIKASSLGVVADKY